MMLQGVAKYTDDEGYTLNVTRFDDGELVVDTTNPGTLVGSMVRLTADQVRALVAFVEGRV